MLLPQEVILRKGRKIYISVLIYVEIFCPIFYFRTNNDSGEPRLSEMGTTVVVVQILPTDGNTPKTPWPPLLVPR